METENKIEVSPAQISVGSVVVVSPRGLKTGLKVVKEIFKDKTIKKYLDFENKIPIKPNYTD